MNIRAQTISIDALIAVALFTMVLIFFFSLSGDTAEQKVKNLQADSSRIISAVSVQRNQTSAFVEGSKVNIDRLESISNLSYAELKNALGISATDFCIHFEDEDGNVINISGNKTGLGSGYIIVGGVACG